MREEIEEFLKGFEEFKYISISVLDIFTNNILGAFEDGHNEVWITDRGEVFLQDNLDAVGFVTTDNTSPAKELPTLILGSE